MKTNIKGQGAVEFVVIIICALFFFVIFFAVVQSNISEKNSEKEEVVLQSVGLGLQKEIGFAFRSSEGYYREFDIPQNILGREYNINFTNSRIYVSMGDFFASYSMLNVTGNVKKGKNIIKKENGSVFLN